MTTPNGAPFPTTWGTTIASAGTTIANNANAPVWTYTITTGAGALTAQTVPWPFTVSPIAPVRGQVAQRPLRRPPPRRVPEDEEVPPAGLDEAEMRQLKTSGYLEVASALVERRVYRIPRLAYGQVEIREPRLGVRGNERCCEIARLCLQPTNHTMTPFQWVALQKLLLLADEERYLKTANHFPLFGTGYAGPYDDAYPEPGERFLEPSRDDDDDEDDHEDEDGEEL